MSTRTATPATSASANFPEATTPTGALTPERVEQFFCQQLQSWPDTRARYDALARVLTRQVVVGRSAFTLQCNPERIRSSAARTDARSLSQRPCFLCGCNRPAPQQSLPWGDGEYQILVNPFPIFPRHLTIAATAHTPQSIHGRIAHMLQLAVPLQDYELFYNGPHCGASAPDHAHFQAGSRGLMPFAGEAGSLATRATVVSEADATMTLVEGLQRIAFVIESTSTDSAASLFTRLISQLPTPQGHTEPMLNILCRYDSQPGRWTLTVFPRRKHRPDCYYATDEAQRLLISPASVDMGGALILAREHDYQSITAAQIADILDEVCITAGDAHDIARRLGADL